MNKFNYAIRVASQALALTPIYPHWLEFRGTGKLKLLLIDKLFGSVLEVGAGEGALKASALKTNSKIRSYIATDFSTWDSGFEEYSEAATSSNFFDALRLTKVREKLDEVCDATNLPFENESFDCHVSMETLEHIPDPLAYFREAERILKPGGLVILTAPFLYRAHPDFESDFFRFLPGAYRQMASINGLVLEEWHANSGIGGTCASLINQYVIRLFVETNSYFKYLLLPALPIVFIATNLIGFVMDIRPDTRFATRFLVVLRKPGGV
jgi:SAM-dependent methyltransferase